MPSSDLTQASPATATRLSFVRWYWVTHPAAILRSWMDYVKAIGALFSFVFLLKTLFAPWKSIRDAYPSKGLNVRAFFETLTLNVTARAIGFIFRVCAMIIGVTIQILVSVGFLAYLLVWILFPLVLLAAIPSVSYLLLS